MSLDNYARQIPAEVRRRRLLTDADPIGTAFSVSSDPRMLLLAEIWYTYIEPGKERSYCPVCLANILTNMKEIRPILIELERAAQTLALL
jgi:hypothetical protein